MFSNADTRTLKYPLKRSLVPEETTPDEAIIQPVFSWATPDNDEQVTITLTLSLNEYVALAAAVDVGRDIAFGQDSIKVWWLWTRAVNTMDLCQQIADCIENDPALQTTITNIVENSGSINPDAINPDLPLMDTRFPVASRDQPIKGAPLGCDNDILWAGIRETVSRLDENVRDFLEDIVVQGDKLQRVNAIIEAVPLIGNLGSAVWEQFAEIAEDLLNLYNSYSSEANMDDIACALFEMVCNDCKYPSYTQYIDYYSSLGISGMDDYAELALQFMMDLVLGLNGLAATVVYHSLITFQLYVLYLKARWLQSLGQDSLGLWASLGEDFPSDNWIALCGGCTPTSIAIEIGATGCNFGDVVGTVQDMGGGVWRISAAARPTNNDNAVYFRRVGGGDFQILTSVLVSGNGATNRAWCLNGVPSASSGGVPIGTCLDSVVITNPIAQAPFVYDITIGEC